MALTAYVNWYVRAGGAETNGGGYDSTIAGAGTNYSDQDSPQLSITDLTSTNSTTCTSVLSTFTAAMVGNVLRIASGAGATTGYYMVTTYVSASTITLDRVSGTYTVGVAKVGGAHASLLNYATAGTLGTPTLTSPLAAGHTVNIRGAGASPDYNHSGGYWTFPAGNITTGYIKFLGIGTRPLILSGGLLAYSQNFTWWENVQFKYAATPTHTTFGFVLGLLTVITNVIVDMNGIDAVAFMGTAGVTVYGNRFMNVEIKNTGSTTAGTVAVLGGGGVSSEFFGIFDGVYIHDVRGPGFNLSNYSGSFYRNIIIANSHSTTGSIVTTSQGTTYASTMTNVTIDGGAGDGINISFLSFLPAFTIKNVIISNHAQAGKYGINVTTGTAAANALLARGNFDYNNFYGNTANYNGINAGANDQTLDPQYTNAAAGDYTIGTNLKALGFPTTFPS